MSLELKEQLYELSASRLLVDLPEARFIIHFMCEVSTPTGEIPVSKILNGFNLTKEEYFYSPLFSKHCALVKLREEYVRPLLIGDLN
jgi:hypothetical protein